jgi:protein kinase-like protein
MRAGGCVSCNFPANPRFPACERKEPTSRLTKAEPVSHAHTPAHAAHAGEIVLNRYRLVRRIGAGGMGVVYLAYDEHLEREVAVKRIAIELDPDARGEREALAAARLSHPGIVALYESGRDEDAVYLVSELVRGRTLAQLIAAGDLSDRDVVRIGVTLCDALEHAHARGVIHRDVKPSNVICPESPEDGSGVAKLTDFGIARMADGDVLTRTGDVIGTLAYMAPEQARGQALSGAADVYALGIVLYEGLSGVNPIRAGNPAATARRVGTRLPALQRVRRDLPAGLCRAVDAAVMPEPAQRAGLGVLRLALSHAVGRVGEAVGPVAGGAPTALMAPEPTRRHDRGAAATPAADEDGRGEEGGRRDRGRAGRRRGRARLRAQAGSTGSGARASPRPGDDWPARDAGLDAPMWDAVAAADRGRAAHEGRGVAPPDAPRPGPRDERRQAQSDDARFAPSDDGRLAPQRDGGFARSDDGRLAGQRDAHFARSDDGRLAPQRDGGFARRDRRRHARNDDARFATRVFPADDGGHAQTTASRLQLRAGAALAAGALAAAALAWLGPPPPLAPAAGALAVAVVVLALPRLGWLAMVAALLAWLAAAAPGIALLVVLAAAPVALLLPRRGAAWSLPAAAPALGLLGLAGAWPALAGQARGWTARAALGALGGLWLVLAEALTSEVLLFGQPRDVLAPGAWHGSAIDAVRDAVVPLLSGGTLAIAALWALAAALLPVLVRGRSAALDLVGAAGWAAALAAATQALSEGLVLDPPRGLVAGALVAGLVAVGARALRGRA